MILASHGIIGSQITQFVGLLDTYSGAAAAYSLRKLRSAYTGSAIEVRNSSGVHLDIGFVNNELDTATLLTHCGSGDGTVSKWYDQSGNGYNATQSTAASQPQIVSSGGIIDSNSKPTLKFDGINDFFSLSSNIVPNTDWSLFGLGAKNQADKPMNFLSNTIGNPNSSLMHWSNGKGYVLNNSSYISTNISYTNLTLTLWSGFVISTTPQSIYRNNILQGTTLINSQIFQNFQHIGLYTGPNYSSANMTEIILYNSDQSSNRSGISDNINDFYSIY